MSHPSATPNHRALLDHKAAALRKAGRKPDTRALAKELAQATGLDRRLALQTVVHYLAGHSPDQHMAQVNRSMRRFRAVMALLAMLGVGSLVWFSGDIGSSHCPWWFVCLLMGLVSLNLLGWVFGSAAKIEFLDCAGCGEPRLADEKGPCPECGSKKYKVPRMSKVALGIVSVFFTSWAVLFLIGALNDKEESSHYWVDVIGWLVVAAFVIAGACGLRVDRFLGKDLEFDEDFDRLSRHPRLALRIVILIASIAAIGLATFRLVNPS